DPLQPRDFTGDLAGSVVPGSALGHGPADPGARRTDVRPAAPGRHDPMADDPRLALADSRPPAAAGNPHDDRALDTPDSRPVLVLERGDPAREGSRTPRAAPLLAALRRPDGRVLHAVGRPAQLRLGVRALLLDGNRRGDLGLDQERADLVSALPDRFQRPSISARGLDRHRLLRSRAVPDLHRPADPLRGVGAAAPAPGRRAGHRGGTIMSPIRVRVCALGLVLVVSSGSAPGLDQAIDPSPESRVRTVLKKQAYPWYDGEKDQVKPLLPDPSSWTSRLEKRLESFFDWLDRRFGKSAGQASGANRGSLRGVLATLLFVASGCVLLVMLWRLWRIHEPQATTHQDHAARIGDAAGAVIWLFLAQLLGLQRAGLLRLTPGRTARQYASGLDDPLLGDGLQATLGVFEEVYYGHRLPGPDELERVWSRAETFRHRLQTIKVE